MKHSRKAAPPPAPAPVHDNTLSQEVMNNAAAAKAKAQAATVAEAPAASRGEPGPAATQEKRAAGGPVPAATPEKRAPAPGPGSDEPPPMKAKGESEDPLDDIVPAEACGSLAAPREDAGGAAEAEEVGLDLRSQSRDVFYVAFFCCLDAFRWAACNA